MLIQHVHFLAVYKFQGRGARLKNTQQLFAYIQHSVLLCVCEKRVKMLVKNTK